MNDIFEKFDFDVLGELYFLTSYQELISATGLNDQILKSVLSRLSENGMIRCYEDAENEIDNDSIDIENLFDKYHYLASKEGLFAHNSR